MTDDRERLFFGFVASLAAGLAVWGMQSRLVSFPARDFIQPEAVAHLAAQLPEDEDEFILAAWDMVGRDIKYEGFASDIRFVDSQVKCLKCFLPAAVLRSGESNCVGKSSLLASLLATRLEGERIRMVIGELNVDGVGGHAWVAVFRHGDWYLLEATKPPGVQPWVRASQLASVYYPMAYISPTGVSCTSKKLCVSFHKASCDCFGDKWEL